MIRRVSCMWYPAAVLLLTSWQAYGAEVLSPEEELELQERSAQPVLECTPEELSTSLETGATATLVAKLRNAGGGILVWSVSFAPAWAKVVPDRGELSYRESRELVIAIDGSNLQPGTTRGDIVIDAQAAKGSPAKLALSLHVKARSSLQTGGTPSAEPQAPTRPVAPLPNRLRYSIGMGWHAFPVIAETSNDDFGLMEPFAMLSWQKHNWEFIASVGIGREWVHMDYSGGEFLDTHASQQLFLCGRRYSTTPKRTRPYLELGYGSVHVELKTESSSDDNNPMFYRLGLGARKFYSHGLFDFSLNFLVLQTSEEWNLYEQHFSSGWNKTWKVQDTAGLSLALGLSF